ncbi:MAG: L-rhamnose/proton symporter RhaT [Lysobacteraceae bacterium]|nr:MAG: L-rhamnose/proton symporter RhaT [Xanthomonadaceae bacterium]
MDPSPLTGVLYHWLGGFSSASFYVPYRGVRRWSWEIYWLTGGIFSWLIAPWLTAAIGTQDLTGVISNAPTGTIFWCIVFGLLWGFGGLTYGLTMRYLGLSLGMAVVLGLSTVFGTLIPPIFAGEFKRKLLDTTSGNIVFLGIVVTIAGIVMVAVAGARKDRELTIEQKAAAVSEFAFKRGIAVAAFSGIMSACFAFGLAAGEPIKELSAAAGTGPLWTGLPVLCLVMFGGLVTNSLWCAWLITRNSSAGQWVGHAPAQDVRARSSVAEQASSAEWPNAAEAIAAGGASVPLARNYLLCAVAGIAWYLQFFFYTMGESQMGGLGFSSWTLHMASIIIFGTLWGFAFREWKEAPTATRTMVWSGVGMLIVATAIIGYGNSLALGIT